MENTAREHYSPRMVEFDTSDPQTDIRDDDPTTEGGPPAWVAYTCVAGMFLIAGMILALLWAFGVFT